MPMPGSWREGPAFDSSLATGTPDPALVSVFRGMRQDARSDPKPTELARVFVIAIGFDGAGLLPTVGQCQVYDLGQLKARITGATIVANGIGSATIDLRLGTFSDVPVLSPISRGGAIPTLASSAAVLLDTSSWTKNLQPFDVLMATLLSVSGALTSFTLSLHCRHLKWPSGDTSVTDSSGNTLTDASGNTLTFRS